MTGCHGRQPNGDDGTQIEKWGPGQRLNNLAFRGSRRPGLALSEVLYILTGTVQIDRCRPCPS